MVLQSLSSSTPESGNYCAAKWIAVIYGDLRQVLRWKSPVLIIKCRRLGTFRSGTDAAVSCYRLGDYFSQCDGVYGGLERAAKLSKDNGR
jgi:hypothetical protein